MSHRVFLVVRLSALDDRGRTRHGLVGYGPDYTYRVMESIRYVQTHCLVIGRDE